MAKFQRLETGKIGLVQETECGRIVQIGLTPEQSDWLHSFLGVISKDSPLVKMGEDYDLVLKSESSKSI
jgi:hypothetical protein